MRKLELFLVPPTCAETRETVRTEPQQSESECSDDALSSKRDSVGGALLARGAARRRARTPTVPRVRVVYVTVGSGLLVTPLSPSVPARGPDGPDARGFRVIVVSII